jgi:glycosyltransferase involved in cell wall biosynthesis
MTKPSTTKIPVTVVIPVKNEEKNLERCISRLNRFKNIIVVDSNSSDKTINIARKFGAQVFQFPWNGRYPKKRNWFLLNHAIDQDWVLFLDADEFVNEAFCDALAQELIHSDKNGYWILYQNFFLGRPLRHGVPQRKLALLRAGKALFEKIEEHHWTSLDMEIHEHPIVEGEVGQIGAKIEHCDDRGISHFVTKHRDYAIWEAMRYVKMREDPSAWKTMTKRQKFKYRNIQKWWFPISYFVIAYFIKLGFLDRSPGFYYAVYKAWYFQNIKFLICEQLQNEGRQGAA